MNFRNVTHIQSAQLRRNASMFAIGISMLLLVTACGSSATSVASKATAVPTSSLIPATKYQVAVKKDIAYGPLSAEKLDLCQPTNATGQRPGIILIHGGGWSGGDKSMYSTACSYLAGQGFIVATINYRLAPASLWPAQIVDSQLAMRWFRSQASPNLDAGRVAAWGDSAGAHLAVFLGTTNAIHAGDEAGLLANTPVQANTVVDYYGPVDLVNGTASFLQNQILLNLFGNVTFDQNKSLYQDASPIFLVSAQTAPTLIIQGSQDTLVPASQSQNFYQMLQADKVTTQYIAYTGGHALSGITDNQKTALFLQAYTFVATILKP